jgi:hypothetical protein
MSDKICSICGCDKSNDAFTNGKSICKTCRNKNEIDRRKKSANHSAVDENKRVFLTHLQKIPLILTENLSIKDQYNKISSALREATELNEKMLKSVALIIPLKVSGIVSDYLMRIDERDPEIGVSCVRTAKEFLIDRSNDVGFEAVFGMAANEVRNRFQEIADLECMAAFVRTVYQVLVEESTVSKHSGFITSGGIRVGGTTTRNQHAIIRYDPHINSIVADENPLRLDKEAFMKGLAELLENKHFNVMMYKQSGHYDKFMEALVS